jgi:hypothetical protein
LPVRGRGDDGPCSLRRVLGEKDAAADEHRLGPERHAQRRIGRSRDPAGRERRHGQPSVARDLRDEIERSAEVLRFRHELLRAERRQLSDVRAHGAKVLHGLDDVARPRLSFRSDHRRSFTDAPQSLAEIAAAADEGNVERALVDVELLVGGVRTSLVDEVDLEGLEDPRFHEMADSALGHHGDVHCAQNGLDHRRVARAGDTALLADLGGNAFERHHRRGTGVLGDRRLLGVDDVHDDAPLEHFGRAYFGGERGLSHDRLLLKHSAIRRPTRANSAALC